MKEEFQLDTWKCFCPTFAMAEVTSMLPAVCPLSDTSALQLSLTRLLLNNGTLNSSPVDHTSSLPAHSRSCRRSAPPALHSPLQFNRLDFHPIPAEQHQLSSSLFKLTFTSLHIYIYIFLFLSTHKNKTHLSWLLFSSSFFFFLHSVLLICLLASSPSPPSATWTEQVSSPLDFAPTRHWRETDLSPCAFCLTEKQQYLHSPSVSAEQHIHSALLVSTGACSWRPYNSRLAAVREISGLKDNSCTVANEQIRLLVQPWSWADWRTTWSSEAWLDCLCF